MDSSFLAHVCAFLLLAAGLAGTTAAAGTDAAAPPNAPAQVRYDQARGTLVLRYHGVQILYATVTARTPDGKAVSGRAVKMTSSATSGEKVEQRLKFALAKPQAGVQLVLEGTVTGSDEAFPTEAAPGEMQKRFPCVRNSVGLSRNLRNHAVYDRRWDWVLVGPGDGATRIIPKTDDAKKRTFGIQSTASSLELIFRPRFYQKHKGLTRFEPWKYRIWKGSPTGYCTWWAYRHSFRQETLDQMLKLFVEKRLVDFGYDYMQFDDTYQHGNGSCPQNWLNWNKKFPGGWKYAIKAIRDAGMKPGIWVHRIHRPSDPHVKDIVKAHPDWFVRKADGSLVMHHGFYMLDTTNKEAVENMVRKLYRGLKKQGWDYVKIDGTGDLLRAYQNKQCADFFKTHPTTPAQSLRAWDIVAREELGPDVYILACHTVGNARHVMGLVDGARLSNDGFQPRTLAQYNYMEGVVWRNDPDHCDVLGMWLMDEDAQMPVFALKDPVPARTVIRPAICAMSGTVLMVSDKAEVYEKDVNIEGMKRSAPVLFTVPGQLYGLGRRTVPWWLQEINRPFERWSVLARIQWAQKRKKEWKFDNHGLPAQEVKFADLGLPADREYLVFEFWGQKYLGKHKGSFPAPAMDENTGMHVFAIREAREHPWVLSTTRHLSQGGVSLKAETWDAARKVLAGTSKVVVGDPYALTVHVPARYRLTRAEVVGEKVQTAAGQETVAVQIVPSATKTITWTLTFAEGK